MAELVQKFNILNDLINQQKQQIQWGVNGL